MSANNFQHMVRTVITPEQQRISINLPENFVGKQVEVIAFTINETLEEPFAVDKPLTHIASEKILTRDWLTPQEDEAWQDL